MHRQLSFTAAMQFEIHTKALENKFCAELNVTIVSRSLRYVAERSGIPSRIRISEIWMVENVEHFRAELEFEPLLNRKILKDRKIGIHEPGADENVASRIAKSELRGQSESTRINTTHKMSRAAIGARRSHDIRALITTTDVCLIARDQDVEWYPRLCRENSVSLPVAQRPSQDIRAIRGRQVVNKAGNQPVANVPVGIAIVTPPIKGIHRRAATVGVGRNINRMRPGVAGQYLQTPVHALTEDCGETVVVGDFVVLNGANHSPKLIRAARINTPGSGLGRVVEVASVQMQRV